MKYLIQISFLLLSITTLANTSNFEIANEAYKEGNFNNAIELYESLLENGENSDVRYNLANAYFKTGRFPAAILNYEKALKLNPTDKDIAYNLQIANMQLKDKIEATPEFFLLTWWKQFAKKQTANRWTVMFLTFLWLGIGLFLLFALTNLTIKKPIFFGGCGSLLIAFFLLMLALTQHQYETKDNGAIIMTASVSVKSEPLSTGKDLFIIHSGLKVTILKKEQDWYNIQLADGKEGWIKEDALAKI